MPLIERARDPDDPARETLFGTIAEWLLLKADSAQNPPRRYRKAIYQQQCTRLSPAACGARSLADVRTIDCI